METTNRAVSRTTRHTSVCVAGYTLAVVSATMLATACASLGPQGDVYTMAETQRPQQVATATVERVRNVEIDASTQTSGLVGELGGGLLGAVAGSAIGEGRGSVLSGIAGGLAGGLAGHEIEQRVEREQGLEITVRMPDGRLQAITQAASEGSFYPGQQVRLLTAADGKIHVTN